MVFLPYNILIDPPGENFSRCLVNTIQNILDNVQIKDMFVFDPVPATRFLSSLIAVKLAILNPNRVRQVSGRNDTCIAQEFRNLTSK